MATGIRTSRIARISALIFALAALAAPSAQASIPGGDRPGVGAAGAFARETPDGYQPQLRIDSVGDFVAREHPDQRVPQEAAPATAPADGLDWGDVAIGAGIALGALAPAAAAVLSVRHLARA